MTETTERISSKIKDDMQALEARLQGVKDRLSKANADTSETIHKKVAEARAAIDEQQAKVKARQGQIEQWIADKKSETAAQIDEWRTNREIHKLEKRAERAEDYALDTIIIAASAVAEADLATLEAIEARIIADEAAGASAS